MEEDKETYQDILQKNFYLFSRYIVAEDFLERLISEDVLTFDDKEVITNKCIHHNRRERTNKLVEILMTRGERGYEKFLEILEYQYPHVYQDVTKKEPRDPPKGFERNRISDRLRIIRNLPNLLEQMKEQVIENSELDSQLCVLQQLLEMSKEENTALEREVEMLKNIRQENKHLMLKIKQMEAENYENQVAISTWTTKVCHLMEAQNEYKDKCNDLQVKYDSLYKEYTDLKTDKSAKDSDQGKVSIPAKESPKLSPPHVDNAPHYRARLDILEQELENYKTQCEEMTVRMQKANDNVAALEGENDKLNKEMRIILKEKKSLEKQFVDAKVKNECQLKCIQNENEKIIELHQRSMAEQQRITELLREKKELFEQNHRLEADLQSCKSELDHIKARFSGSSFENNGSSQEQGSSGSDAEAGDTEDLPRVHRTIQDFDGFDIGLQCLSIHQRRKVVKKCYTGERYAERLAMQKQGSDILGDDDMSQKANTLPAKANESPEKLFLREVAHFRYSRKREQPLSDSMSVNTGSVCERQRRVRTGSPILWQETMQLDNTCKREATMNPADPQDDVQDNASESTVYIPRTSGRREQQQEVQHAHSQSSGSELSSSSSGSTKSVEKSRSGSLPTGGKVVFKRDNIDRQKSSEKERVAKCDSILSQGESSSDSNITSDFSSHEVYTALLPKDCLVLNRPGWTDKNMSRLVRVKYSHLSDKLEVKGGNHTGIFIMKQEKLLELNEGEQIKGIIFTPYERVNPVITNLKGCTLEDFHRLVAGDFINKKKLREICLEVRNSKDEYASACEWMKSNNGNGDYFFIRCNVNLDKKREDNISLKSGDIFLVKNSYYGEEQWQGHMIDAATGVMAASSSFIPNMQQANLQRLAYVRSYSTEEDDPLKRGGRRVKGQAYDRVLPMKASTKLPVYIIGPDGHVVSSILDLILSNLSNEFIVDSDTARTGDNGSEWELYRHDMHIVRGSKLENIKSRQSIHRITVLVNVTTELSSNDIRKLFGNDSGLEFSSSTVSQCQTIRQKLVESGHYFEEISIPTVNTKEGLLQSFKTCIEVSQNRILWLSSKEMDEQVANRYPSLLGQLCDLSKIQADFHQAHGF